MTEECWVCEMGWDVAWKNWDAGLSFPLCYYHTTCLVETDEISQKPIPPKGIMRLTSGKPLKR